MIAIPRDLEPLVPCRNGDPEAWFPERRAVAGDPGYARALCMGCPLRAECLDAELEAMRHKHGTHGIFGGTTEDERRQTLRIERRTLAGAQ